MNLEGRPDLAALIPQIHKIVVVDLGFLGDTVHLVPALWQIHCQFPAASLQVVTTPVGGAVLSMLFVRRKSLDAESGTGASIDFGAMETGSGITARTI